MTRSREDREQLQSELERRKAQRRPQESIRKNRCRDRNERRAGDKGDEHERRIKTHYGGERRRGHHRGCDSLQHQCEIEIRRSHLEEGCDAQLARQ